MTKPRALGTIASGLVAETIADLSENDRTLRANERTIFDIVLLIQSGDKNAATEALKRIVDNGHRVCEVELHVRNVLTYLRAGEIEMARELILETARHLPGGSKGA